MSKAGSSSQTSGVLVLGMHRSGTSALARVLNLCGMHLGSRLVDGGIGNEQGHWESAFAVETDDALLHALGRDWSDVRPMPRGWVQLEPTRRAITSITHFSHEELEHNGPWCLKDPRMCRLLPAWRAGLGAAGLSFGAVLAWRHPEEVAASLAARDGIPRGSALLLWLQHTIEAAETLDGVAVSVVGYAQLLADWRATTTRVVHELGLESLKVAAQVTNDIDGYLDHALRHHRVKENPLGTGLPAAVSRAYEILLGETDGAVAVAALRDLRNELDAATDLYGPVLENVHQQEQVLWRRTAAAEAAVADTASGLRSIPLGMQQLEASLGALRERMVATHDILKGTLKSRDARIDLLMQDVAAHELEIQTLGATLATKTAELKAKTAEAGQLYEWLDARATEVGQLREQLTTKTTEAGQLREALVMTTGRAERLQRVADERNLIVASWSWQLTKPLRWAMRLVRRVRCGLTGQAMPAAGVAQELLPSIQALASTEASAPQASSQAVLSNGRRPLPVLTEQAQGMDDIYVWGVIDWHFRIQRPQHLARELTHDGHRVFYISNSMVDDAGPGFRVEPLDDSGRLFQINLFAADRPIIYHGAPAEKDADNLRNSLAEMLTWSGSRSTLSLVQHPYWTQTAQLLPSNRLVYDCMDHHAGFENNSACVLDLEHSLMRQADLLVFSSQWLQGEYGSFNANHAVVRNAGDYAHFSEPPSRVYADPQGRKVIGYYGAIAEWFDAGLVGEVARSRPDCVVLLIGRDTAAVQEQLQGCDNVVFTGEVSYDDLPYYLHGFDVCLLPFHVIPLTLATNPVKLYEYLGAGKTVVSVDLPEIHQFGDLVVIAADRRDFVQAVSQAVDQPPAPTLVERRRQFASEQTWSHRAGSLLQAVETITEPSVSIVVVTYNNLDFTKACLRSLETYSDYDAMEIIVVDNASSDGTQAYLEEWARQGPRRNVILSPVNTGFAAGNNLGLAAAQGDYLVMLNNDTYVTPGWVRTLIGHIRRDPGIGLIGPVTNNIGNEARIDTRYLDMAGMIEEAGRYTRRHAGREMDMRTVAFFCVAMSRSTYERVGPLDEAFGVGFFEDDDYCRRVDACGLRVACAEDVFVHHHLSASFDKLKQEHRKELFERNKAIYEAKWGEWVPHAYRK